MRIRLMVAVLTTMVSLAAQQPIDQNGGGTVVGRVVRAAEGIPDATVTLAPSRSATARPQTTTTDVNGNYVFSSVAPGAYTLEATRNGYIVPARTLSSSPASNQVAVSAGDRVHAAAISLIQGAVITGIVFDPNGKPAPEVLVAVEQMGYTRGRRTLTGISGAQITDVTTDDRGRFRLFGLPTGEYCVVAEPTLGRTPPGRETWMTTYYPTAVDPLAAVPLMVKEGEEVNVKALTIQTSPVFSISGTVVNPFARTLPDGRTTNLVNIFSLVPRNSAIKAYENRAVVTTLQNGQFVLRGVHPGSYDLYPLAPSTQNSLSPFYTGRTPIEVGSEDLKDITVTVRAGVDVRVTLVVPGDGTRRTLSPTARVRLWPVDDLPGLIANHSFDAPEQSTPQGAPNTSTFTFSNIADARYSLELPRGVGLYISDMRQGVRSIIDDGVVTVGSDPVDVHVTFSAGAGRIEGTVRNVAKMRRNVVLIPQGWRHGNSSFYVTNITDEDGAFRLGNIAPGEYKLYAFEDIPNDAWLNSQYMAPYETRGKAVSISSGASLSEQLDLIPSLNK